MLLSLFTELSTQESEITLLQNVKRYTEQIQQQQFHMQQAENFPDAFTTEVSKMREQLLKYQNEYNAAKEREYHNQYRLNRWVWVSLQNIEPRSNRSCFHIN